MIFFYPYLSLLVHNYELKAMADPGWGIWGKKLHTRSRYSNRAVNYSNKAVTMFMNYQSIVYSVQPKCRTYTSNILCRLVFLIYLTENLWLARSPV